MSNSFKNLLALCILAFATFSFTTIEEGVSPAGEEKKVIKTENSKLVWKGYKVTGSHEGTIDIESGSLIMKDGVLKGGEITINMQSIITTDLEGEYIGPWQTVNSF